MRKDGRCITKSMNTKGDGGGVAGGVGGAVWVSGVNLFCKMFISITTD